MFSFKHRWIADILVLSLIVYFGVDAFITVLNSRLAPTPAMQEEAVKLGEKPAADARPLGDYAIITERNLFGGTSQGLAEVAPEEIVLDDMPVALKSLGLRLVGTVVANKPEESSAIIEDQSSRKQEVYQEGDRVKQALIKRILRHNVVINAGRRDEVLTMVPEESTGRKPAPKRAPRTRPRPSAGRSIRLDREELESQMANLNELMQQVRIRPFMEGKQPAGFLVSNIKPGSLFSKMGLRNGDVIQGVNGETITTPDQAVELYESLMEGGEIALEIKRGRRQQNLRYEVE
ncbi:MAG: PDZ domain-containing protein [Deltaproteobacteria bacterium]|nr:MAG: PDZ domain-containing protein [Deltaproteobacteria bacterium]